ncbi:MAG: PAS domain S-box protein [bacterium]
MITDGSDSTRDKPQRLNAAIVGGGRGCEALLRMAAADRLGRFRMRICGVADSNPEAPGLLFAQAVGVPMIAHDFHQLFEIPHLDLILELTGSIAVRDELERTRPRHVRLIDHFGASLFWELFTAEEEIIHQRTEMRERVEEERQWITQIFDSIPDEIVVVDTNMVVRDANASFLRNNGYSEIGDVRGRHCYEIEQRIRGECQVAVEDCPFFTAMRHRTTTSIVRKHFDRMGRARFAALVAAPLLDADGKVAGVIESTRDISHRILLEEELKATESRLKQFMDLAPVAGYVKSLAGQYLEVNPAACKILGRERYDILGKTDLEILPREAAELFRAGDREVWNAREPVSRDEEVTLDGEHPVYLSSIRFPVMDAEGAVTALCGLLRDVTALKTAEAELDRTRDHLRNVANHSPMIIVTMDMGGNLLSFNPGAEASLGYRADEVIGESIGRLFPDRAERHRLQRRVTEEGAVRDHETQLLRKDGTAVPVSMTLSQLRNADDTMVGTVGIAKDISQRKTLMNQMMQSERMAAVGRLAAGVAHEINNPLAVISEIAGYLDELLKQDPAAQDEETQVELRESMPKITKHVNRCRSITKRLLTFARKSAARVEFADVNAALEEIIPFVEKDAQLAKVTIEREYDETLPKVRMEEMQLQEIFINLLTNAIQAVSSDGSGRIWLRTALVGGKVHVTVADNGPGIDPDVANRLFDPFVTTKAPGVGTGLGLSICYAIVKRYDGEISVESTPGAGAKFTVVLPVKRESDDETEATADDQPPFDPVA